MQYDECRELLSTYFETDQADPTIASYLRDVLAWADEARVRERFLVEDAWSCVINTEVNSGNLLWNPDAGTLPLVDWEKALWGDPSQDLSHFSVPTTTLWKSDWTMTAAQRRAFLARYKTAIPDTHLRSTIEERVALRDPFNCLRGISWSAMAWIKYQAGEQPIRNADTFRTMESYRDIAFLREILDPCLRGGA